MKDDRDKWRLIKELDDRYQKRTDKPVRPVPDCTYGAPTSILSATILLVAMLILGAFAMWLTMTVFGG